MKKSLLCLGLLAFVSFTLASLSLAQPGRIAFINGDLQLATVNPDGSELRVLTEGAQRLQFPAWSAEGKIASIGIDREGGFIRVYDDVAETDGTEIYRSASEAPIYLYWSPDGSTVSFLANNPQSGLALHLASETNAPSLLANGAPFYWQWQSDSTGMLIHTGFTGPNSRLGFTSAASDTLTENLAPPGLFQAPGISASGNYIAYAEDDEFRGTQVIIQQNPLTDTAEVKREVEHEGATSLSWSPTEDKLAFTAPARGAPAVYGELNLLEAESGLLETLSENLVVAFFWSPDGRYIAYLTPSLEQRDEGDVSMTTQPMLVSQKVEAQKIQRGSFLLELHVVDIATKEDKRLATFTPTFLFLDQFMPFFDQYALSHRLWSPDSSAIVLPITNADSTKQITVFGLDGTVTAVGEGDTPFWSK
jgi:TolB protein